MRLLIVIPLLLVASCGGEAPPEEKKSARLAAMEAGQFELASEVTSLSNVDQGASAINTPVGTKANMSICLSGSGRAPTELFSGEGYECSYNNYYARNGRINALLNCTRSGLQGDIAMTVDGTFEAGQIRFNRNIRTILAGDGDVLINERVTGRRTGDCAAEVTEGNKAG
jgi:hypothetical protein